MTPKEGDMLTVADVCRTLKCGPGIVYRLIRSGQIRAVRLGGRGPWRIKAASLASYQASAKAPPRDSTAPGVVQGGGKAPRAILAASADTEQTGESDG